MHFFHRFLQLVFDVHFRTRNQVRHGQAAQLRPTDIPIARLELVEHHFAHEEEDKTVSVSRDRPAAANK